MKTKQDYESCYRHSNTKPVWSSVWEQSMLCEEHCQIEYNPDHGCGDCGENCGQILIPTQILNERSADEDPKEAGSEGGPGADQPAYDSCHDGIKSMWVMIGSHESHKLRNHNQGTRRCLGQSQAIKHLFWFYPSIVVNRLLCQISEH